MYSKQTFQKQFCLPKIHLPFQNAKTDLFLNLRCKKFCLVDDSRHHQENRQSIMVTCWEQAGVTHSTLSVQYPLFNATLPFYLQVNLLKYQLESKPALHTQPGLYNIYSLMFFILSPTVKPDAHIRLKHLLENKPALHTKPSLYSLMLFILLPTVKPDAHLRL